MGVFTSLIRNWNPFGIFSKPKLIPYMYFTDNSEYALILKSSGEELFKSAVMKVLYAGKEAIEETVNETFEVIAKEAGNALSICAEKAAADCPLGSTPDYYAERLKYHAESIDNEYYQIVLNNPIVDIKATDQFGNPWQETVENTASMGYNKSIGATGLLANLSTGSWEIQNLSTERENDTPTEVSIEDWAKEKGGTVEIKKKWFSDDISKIKVNINGIKKTYNAKDYTVRDGKMYIDPAVLEKHFPNEVSLEDWVKERGGTTKRISAKLFSITPIPLWWYKQIDVELYGKKKSYTRKDYTKRDDKAYIALSVLERDFPLPIDEEQEPPEQSSSEITEKEYLQVVVPTDVMKKPSTDSEKLSKDGGLIIGTILQIATDKKGYERKREKTDNGERIWVPVYFEGGDDGIGWIIEKDANGKSDLRKITELDKAKPWAMSEKDGTELLSKFEVGAGAKDKNGNPIVRVDKNGKITEIRTSEIGDGGYTVGFGHWIGYDDQNSIDEFKEKWGIDPTDTTKWISYEKCLEIFKDDVGEGVFRSNLNRFLINYNITLKPHQYDAMLMYSYQQGPNIWSDRIINEYPNGFAAFFVNNKNRLNDDNFAEKIRDAFLKNYQGDPYWIEGLKNRHNNEANLFITGKYDKLY